MECKGDAGLSRVKQRRARLAGRLAIAILAGSLAGACGITQVYHHGYMVPDGALEQIPLGSSQEQVLIVLGTPSTVATLSGEVFYYISQTRRADLVPAAAGDRPPRGRRLFRQEPPGPAPRRLRAQGRQDLQLRSAAPRRRAASSRTTSPSCSRSRSSDGCDPSCDPRSLPPSSPGLSRRPRLSEHSGFASDVGRSALLIGAAGTSPAVTK